MKSKNRVGIPSALEQVLDVYLFYIQQRVSVTTSSVYLLGEGDGTPLQYCCPENPMDGGAWWAAVHGVAKSRA